MYKVETAVRLSTNQLELMLDVHLERSQLKNREHAMQILLCKIRSKKD